MANKTMTVIIETEPNSAKLISTSYREVLSINKSDPMFWTIEYLDDQDRVIKSSYNKKFIFRLTQHDND